MGRTARSEKDVLKLVHPGKHIERYTKPILASEVLNKYPKFCITRPDVFKFPWIVVKPDSLLVPGDVFFLVPKRTLYHLLKANQPPDGSRLPPSCCLSLSGPSSPLTENAGMTPKYQTHLPIRLKSSREEDGRKGRKNSHIEYSWLPSSSSSSSTVVGNKRNVRYSTSHVHDCNKLRSNIASTEVVSGNDVGNGGGRGRKRKTTSLRSSMRKPGSVPRLANPKVRFSIPNEDIVEPVTKQRTVIEFLSKLATSLIIDVCR